MCGIVGYIGNKKASPILIKGLLNLEYRGYDSAGLSTIEADSLSVLKDKGRTSDLQKLEGIDTLEGTIGIAHTRWATHGKPSKVNSHPHLDNTNTFSVVHNGIIENYTELRRFLGSKGYNFLSETDTEVIPNLIHYYYEQDTIDDDLRFLRSVKNACSDLKGSYAIEVISSLYKDKMIVVKKDSPLVIGKGEQEYYIASDIPAILSNTKEFYLLEDYDFVLLERDNISFFDKSLNKFEKLTKCVDWDMSSAEKGEYEDYMLKEIFEQPTAVRETIGTRIQDSGKCSFDELSFTKEYLSELKMIYIVACGTAMHAGLSGKNAIEKLCNIPCIVDIASEFRYRDPLIDKNTLCIFISQSGETADTIAALKLARQKGAKTLCVSNVIGSSITREADYSIYTHAGPEIAVASTKAYTSQIVLLELLAIYFSEVLELNNELLLSKLKSEIRNLPSMLADTLKCSNRIKEFAKTIYTQKDVFFLGRGSDYITSQEGALKLKEISYIHAEAYAAGELKHGTIALIEDNITVIGTLTDEYLLPKTISNLQEVITRGAKTLIITNQELPNSHFDTIIKISEASSITSTILAIIPLQLLAYYVSKEKGLDVDKPRNLAKSVTVE